MSIRHNPEFTMMEFYAAYTDYTWLMDFTEAVIRQMSAIAKEIPGVESSIAFPGLSINGFTNAPNAGIVFTSLKPFKDRKGKDMSADRVQMEAAHCKDLRAIWDGPLGE
ncbi:MAG TPA: hypothetical protein DCE49_07965 [Pseudomonas sp.]|nr:hypothetical protein [Pseudomonas sp.]